LFSSHSTPLVIAYLIALGGWVCANRILPGTWQKEPYEALDHPRAEFGFALLGGLAVLLMGMIWSKGIRIPEKGIFTPILAAINQILIFAPMILVIVIRRQSWASAWIPRGRIAIRLLLGFVLAGLAITVYSFLRAGADWPLAIFGRIWAYDHVDKLVQVFLEDITIAILFVRLAGIIGRKWATVVVACLFAAGHIPAMVSQGATWFELLGLFRDAGLGVAVILVLQRSRDIIWFWLIHYCLDMTQFEGISGVG
jgi:hypothetical protein